MPYLLIIAIFGILATVPVHAAPKKAPKAPVEWTLKDTVSSALNYSPAVKGRKEAVNMAHEGVRQAQSGHLPRVRVEGQTGFGTLPVSKYD